MRQRPCLTALRLSVADLEQRLESARNSAKAQDRKRDVHGGQHGDNDQGEVVFSYRSIETAFTSRHRSASPQGRFETRIFDDSAEPRRREFKARLRLMTVESSDADRANCRNGTSTPWEDRCDPPWDTQMSTKDRTRTLRPCSFPKIFFPCSSKPAVGRV